MAYLDSADLLARTKRLAEMQVPAEYPRDTDWYAWLTERQDYWVGVIAQHDARILCGAPVLLSSTDGGATYTFPTVPVAIEEITIGQAGTPLRLGPDYDPTVDASWEGDATLRIARNTTRSFASGLYARYVAQPDEIRDDQEPTLPTMFRLLLPPGACVLYARSGGARNPAPYLDEETRLWSGDPSMPGDTGILGRLKKRAFAQSVGSGTSSPWWRTGDLGR
jgi:hypothetical protein